MNCIVGLLLSVATITVGRAETPAMPEVAAPVAPKKVEEIDLQLVPQECVPSTLDTTGPESQGNWVLKRAFWQQASDAYEKLLKDNDQLFTIQLNFLTQRNEASKKIDAAFTAIGLGQGEMRELISLLVEDLQQERQVQPAVHEAERELMNELQEKQKELEQLAQQVLLIDEIDNALEQVQSKTLEQINRCREFEKKAWADFKQIGLELSDKRAQELYYQIESYVQSNAAIIHYLTNDLANYLTTTTTTLDHQISLVNKSVDKMKEQGIELQEEYARLTQQENADMTHVQQAQAVAIPIAPNWWHRILAWFAALWQTFMSLFR